MAERVNNTYVLERMFVLELPAGRNQALHVGWRTIDDVNLCLEIIDGVGELKTIDGDFEATRRNNDNVD